ncbi:alanine racemase [Novosphingobium cyanobacteriorum]|uniref:alanine racemase n=1 Tax=Novosphingobium cyanobacteriorum TaxID=3024215 RepID=A0ABT6CDM4_9SPHN|nr:alanine racemase [Novosphingobium cyanobacteriorum]MDF8331906.1 alanine racemase [Novosphingobium cyanobacteriorum]
MPDLPPAALRLRLDAGALAANWKTLDVMSGAARAGAAVKADAYGLGAAQVVPVLAEAGCADWFVAHWQEVPEVLRHVPGAGISVLHGPMNHADVGYARATGVRTVLNSLEQVRRWREAGGGACDVMVDTGMNRLGLPMAALGDPLLQGLQIDTCLSHLASADEDVAQNAAQLARFAEVRAQVRARRYSLANSAGIGLGSAYHADVTRPGIALYGGIPRGEFVGRIAQVAHPEAAVIQVRTLQVGDQVGYNATFTADRPIRAGVIAVGYADGYLRTWSGGKGHFLWQGCRLPVLGRVSMDMTIVDLTGADDCGEGDWLQAYYNLPDAARASGLSQYELLTLMGRRFARFT